MRLNQIAKTGEILEMRVGIAAVRAKIEAFVGQDGFIIIQPTYKRIPVNVERKQPFDFSFQRDDGIFAFTAVLDEAYEADGLRFFRFTLATRVVRIQRRSAFRLPVDLDVTLRLRRDDGADGEDVGARTINVSHTGVLFASPVELVRGERFGIRLTLDEEQSIGFDAQVVWVQPPPRQGDEYRVAAHFEDGANFGEKRLAKYIFREQIRRRKAEKADGAADAQEGNDGGAL